MLRRIDRSGFKTKYISALIAVFTVGLLAWAGNARESTRSAEAVPQTAHPAFTLTTSRTIAGEDKRERLISTQQRFQRSDGAYKLVQTLHASVGTAERVQTLFGFISLGVFRLDEAGQRLVFIGPLVEAGPGDVEQLLRGSQLFARDESVAGISAIVWRKPGRARGEFVEEYHAASLGGLLIKMVKVSARGRETVEPTSIQMGEPGQSLFNELLSYRSDYSSYERRVQETVYRE